MPDMHLETIDRDHRSTPAECDQVNMTETTPENVITGASERTALEPIETSPVDSPSCSNSTSPAPVVQKCSSFSKTLADSSLQPVGPRQQGEGFPYAPEGWPNPGDKWIWKVGRRKNGLGYWLDRYLILPRTLQEGSRKVWFTSKRSVEKYLTRKYPDADLENFFSSFQWNVPCAASPSDEDVIAPAGKRMRRSNVNGNGMTAGKRFCKAGNSKCCLEIGKGKNLNSLDCDVCCVETGFCRECSCILCGKSIDQNMGQYNFVRCEGKLHRDFICGHVAHLECAVVCQMAGVVTSIGLDVEYYCRRCDKKTDLLTHVMGLIPTPELSIVRADVERSLNLVLCLIQGTQQFLGRSLENLIQNAIKKLQNGMDLQGILNELQGNSIEGIADKVDNVKEKVTMQIEPSASSPILHTKPRDEFVHWMASPVCATAATNETFESTFQTPNAFCKRLHDSLQSTTVTPDISSEQGNTFAHDQFQQRARLFSEDVHRTSDSQSSTVNIAVLKFENKVYQALHLLRQSQETEYKLAQEKLFAQKDLLLNLFQQLEMRSSENTHNPSASLENFAQKEYEKFVLMLGVANGFGRTPKNVLNDYFGMG
eukprot:Gb_12072 [translate_table: standard]